MLNLPKKILWLLNPMALYYSVLYILYCMYLTIVDSSRHFFTLFLFGYLDKFTRGLYTWIYWFD